MIVGARPTAAVQALSREDGVTVTGEVRDVGPFYRQADVVIAPVRARGGTRLKILEAMSYRRAVVATTAAAEGLQVRDGREILLANDPTAFSGRCLMLMADEGLRRTVSMEGYRWVRRRHTPDAVRRALRSELERSTLHKVTGL